MALDLTDNTEYINFKTCQRFRNYVEPMHERDNIHNCLKDEKKRYLQPVPD